MSSKSRFERSAVATAVAQALVAAGGLSAAGAAAQAPAVTELAPVIVTAKRRAEDILDVPYNISAVSGAAIEAAQVFDTPELLRSVPGVGIVDRGPRNAAVVNGMRIRGLNVDSSILGDYAVSAVATVSSYVNDTPILANFLLRDIERVEVLRGPQGTLYGSGSLGGTVRYVMREPELGQFAGKASVNVSQSDGSDGTGWGGDLLLNMPLGDRFAVRLNVSHVDNPGIIDYVNLYELDANGLPVAPNGVLAPDTRYTSRKDADTVEITYARVSARWQPSDAFSATLSHFHQEDDIGGRRQPTLGSDGWGRPYRRYENGSIQLEPATRDVDLTSLEMNLDLGFATLTSSTSVYDHQGDSTSENTGFYAQAGFLVYYYFYPRPMAAAERSYRDEGFVQELRLVSKGGSTFDYVVGLYYQDQDIRSTQDSYLVGFKRWWDTAYPAFASAVTGDRDFLYRRREQFKEKALYGELTWHVTDRLSLTGGLRYFDNESRNDTTMDLPAYASFSQPISPTFRSDEDDVLLKGNLAWEFAADSLFYLTVSEGYRRGGSNAVPLTGTFRESPLWQLYGADTVTNYEAGIKGRAGGLRYDASLFHIDWKDAQFNTATPNWGFYATVNGGHAEAQGLELQLSGNAGERFSYSFGYAYVKAELTEDFFSPTGALVERNGARLPGVPENMLNVAFDYRMPLTNGWELVTHVDGYYQSDTRNALSRSARFDVDLPSFQVWGAALTLNADKWSGSLWVKNLGNEEGVTGVYTEAYMGSDPSQGYFGNGSKELYSLPRTVGLTLTYSF